jgi:hypothetical protein
VKVAASAPMLAGHIGIGLWGVADRLLGDDVVVVEARGNAASVAAVIAPHVKKVVIGNPMQVRIITALGWKGKTALLRRREIPYPDF